MRGYAHSQGHTPDSSLTPTSTPSTFHSLLLSVIYCWTVLPPTAHLLFLWLRMLGTAAIQVFGQGCSSSEGATGARSVSSSCGFGSTQFLADCCLEDFHCALLWGGLFHRAAHSMTANFHPSAPAREQMTKSKMEATVSLKLHLCSTIDQLCHILSVRRESLGSACAKRWGITQRHEYQEIGSLGAILKVTYPIPPPAALILIAKNSYCFLNSDQLIFNKCEIFLNLSYDDDCNYVSISSDSCNNCFVLC